MVRAQSNIGNAVAAETESSQKVNEVGAIWRTARTPLLRYLPTSGKDLEQHSSNAVFHRRIVDARPLSYASFIGWNTPHEGIGFQCG